MAYIHTLLLSLGWLVALPAIASGLNGTPEQAKALVKKAISYYHAYGEQHTMAALNDLNGAFIQGNLYVFVHDDHGIYYAMAHNPEFIGKDLALMRDTNGKFIIKEQLEALKHADSMWHEYDWMDPLSHTIRHKRTYCEKVGRLQFCAGAYGAPAD